MSVKLVKTCKKKNNKGLVRLETTLQAGQAFRWKYLGDEWSCAFNNMIILLKQDGKKYMEKQGMV